MSIALISVSSDLIIILHFTLSPLNFAIYKSHCLFLLYTSPPNIKHRDLSELESGPRGQSENLIKEAGTDSRRKPSSREVKP